MKMMQASNIPTTIATSKAADTWHTTAQYKAEGMSTGMEIGTGIEQHKEKSHDVTPCTVDVHVPSR
jgi:hypothetical protein